MTDGEKAKLAAAGKIAFGALRMGGAVVTATGHGLVGAACRQHHMMGRAWRFAAHGFAGGKRMLDDGLAEWRGAK